MHRFQFSILGLIGLMALVAVGCAAMVNASAGWCSAVAIFLMLALLNSIVGVVYRRGKDRAYWVGFLVFGWGSLFLLFENPLVPIRSPQPECFVNNVFISNHLKKLYDATHSTPSGGYTSYGSANLPLGVAPSAGGPLAVNPPGTYFGAATVYSGTLNVVAVDSAPEHYFQIIGNLLFVMLCALAGGFFARSFYAPPAGGEDDAKKKGELSCNTL
jgi:hypothetical protein